MSDRCEAMYTEHCADMSVRCFLPSDTHKTHAAWINDNKKVAWSDPPKGPSTTEEFEAIAWEFTGGLGIEMRYDPLLRQIVLDRNEVAKRWDRMTDREKMLLLGAYESYREHG